MRPDVGRLAEIVDTAIPAFRTTLAGSSRVEQSSITSICAVPSAASCGSTLPSAALRYSAQL
ncbi:MAG: hypothetical protein ABJC89_06990 [Acidobacteriota bacterium]